MAKLFGTRGISHSFEDLLHDTYLVAYAVVKDSSVLVNQGHKGITRVGLRMDGFKDLLFQHSRAIGEVGIHQSL